MRTYPKIQSVFKRDPENNHRTFIDGDWSDPAFGYLAENEWEATEKIDGTNMRIGFNEGTFRVGGRTESSQIHSDLMEHVYEIGDRCSGVLEGLTLFGEGYGAGIQKGGGDYRPDKGFILFDVQVTESGIWLERENIRDIARTHGMPHVATSYVGPLKTIIEHVSLGFDTPSAEGDRQAEGFVMRPIIELNGRMGNRIITKIKLKDYPDRLKT